MHLDRLITLLELIATAGRPVSVAEAQRATGLPRPTCYRLLQTLADHRLIESPNGDGRYLIGDRLIRIALLGNSDADVRQAAAPLLRKTAAALGDSVFLSRLRGGDVEIIHVETPEDPARPFFHPGLGRRPLHACSCAKVIAAFAEPEFQQQLLNDDLARFTEHTKTTPDEIRGELDAIVRRGYAECKQEIEMGVVSVAAPVRIGNVGVTFSVGAIGPVRKFSDRYCAKVGKELMELSREVSGAIQLCTLPER
ncbi:MAG: IclR family transcriptional regulator [Alphaproteobacteria bacterium]|nr:MAG: IclR family transcriptional regulator [Alphaproteobacteria bacterium]